MDYELLQGTCHDYDDMIDFANYVFAKDFKKLAPNFYNDKPETASEHWLIKEKGKIKAMLLCHESDVYIDGKKLRMAGIGQVGVHPYCRGKGYMKILMNHAVEESRKRKVDIMDLGGQRQRYEHFGFSPCETVISMSISKSAMDKCIGIDTEKIQIYTADKYPELALKCRQLQMSQPVYVVREGEFFSSREINIVFFEGEFIGYIIGSKERISEIFLMDYSKSLPAIFKYADIYQSENLTLTPMFFQQGLIAALSSVCEDRRIATSYYALNVLNYQKLLEACLGLKNKICPLKEGSLVFDIEQQGQYTITVKNNEVTVTESTLKTSHRTMNHLQAMDFMFSPIQPLIYQECMMTDLESSWFPLHFLISRIDCV